MCHKKSLFSPPELSAGGAKRDTCLALPAISRLWPSDDDDDVDDADNDDDDGDIYIMMSVCVFVTKNEHFLLGVSCNHLNPQ